MTIQSAIIPGNLIVIRETTVQGKRTLLPCYCHFSILMCMWAPLLSQLKSLRITILWCLLISDYSGGAWFSRNITWSLVLQEYNMEIEHIKGKENIMADALSRAM